MALLHKSAVVFACLALYDAQAFAPCRHSRLQQADTRRTESSTAFSVGGPFRCQSTEARIPPLRLAAQQDSQDTPRENDDRKDESDNPKAESNDADADADANADADAEADANDSQKEQEDPELKALKQRIADLESSLAAKKNTLQYTLEKAEQFSKAGYARKVAEMENMRRIRNNLATSSQSSSKANVLKDFLPIYDSLDELKSKYSDDEFGSKYGGLTMNSIFRSMGVTEYSVEPGTEVDHRVKVASRQASTDFAKDAVIEQISSGLELDGNVLKEAACVVSLGSEDETADASDESTSDDDDDESDGSADASNEGTDEGDASKDE